MEKVKKYNLLVWFTIFLLAMNLIVVSVIWFRPPLLPEKKEYRRGEPTFLHKGVLIEELKLDSTQINFYKQSRKEHYRNMRKLKNDINNYKRLIHKEIFSQSPDTIKIYEWSDSIGKLNSKFETNNYQHFIELKSSLNEEQIIRLKQLMDESLRIDHNERHRSQR